MIDLSGLVAQVCNIAVDTGAFLREQRAAFDRSVVQEKGPHDYVSYVDKASEQRLVEALAALLPEAGFVTEEKTTGQYAGEEYCWDFPTIASASALWCSDSSGKCMVR